MSDYPKRLSEKIRHTRALELLLRNHFDDILNKEGVTDVCYNGKDTIFYMDGTGQWKEEPTDLRFDDALAIATAAASARKKNISELNSILSADLPNGERVQFLIPPAVDYGICIIAIRIPSKIDFTIEDYEKQGMFDYIKKAKEINSSSNEELIRLYKNMKFGDFLKMSVEERKNIIFTGDTGVGKTTFARTFINYIPPQERLISIEDTKEIIFKKHRNSINLYYPDTAKPSDSLNPESILNACLRLFPSRILMTEIRNKAGAIYLNALRSGHSGSITSMHAETVKMAFRRLIDMYKSGTNLPDSVAEDEVKSLIDIIVCIRREKNSNKRYISDIYFKEVDYDKE